MSEYKFSFRSYSRTLNTTLRMSRGEINTRNGIIVRLESESGKITFGEAVTLPYFGTETVEQGTACCKNLPKIISRANLEKLSLNIPATRFAIESAILQNEGKILKSATPKSFDVSKLLSSKENVLEEARKSLLEGYTTFKWKIGIAPLEDEIDVLERLLALLPSDFSLRLDANGGLSKKDAAIWLKASQSTQVEFIEQPLHPEEDLKESISLSETFSTPIALDESVSSYEDLSRCYNDGWRGIFVVKVLRLRELEKFLNWRELSNAQIVYSSALETSVGTELGILIASGDLKNERALGYGVSHWFQNDGLYIHKEGPKLNSLANRDESLERLFLSIEDQ